MTAPAFTDELIDVAAQLIGSVRDYGPEVVASVLATVPEGRHDALAVVLAAMVDPDRTPGELLAWMDTPPQSREFTPLAFRTNHSNPRRAEVQRLTRLGWTARRIADELGIGQRTVHKYRVSDAEASA